MKKFFVNENGSVSIYLIIIFTAIFMLNAVLIDYARIFATKNKTENLVKTSLRSTLSNFDSELYLKYGLFGLDNSLIEGEFVEAYEKNIANYGGFNFSGNSYQLENIQLTNGHQLADHDIFQYQILEDMKYQAPINLAEDFIGIYESFSNTMEDSSDTMNVINDVKSLYDKRQVLLNKAVEYQNDSALIVDSNSNFIQIKTTINEIDNYILNVDKVQNNQIDEDELADAINEIDQFEDKVKQINNLYSDYKNVIHNKNLTKAITNISEAETINKQIKDIVNNAQEDNSKGVNEFNNLINDLEFIILSEDYFTQFTADINKQIELYDSLTIHLEEINNGLNDLLNNPKQYTDDTGNSLKTELLAQLNIIENTKDEYRQKYLENGNLLEERKKDLIEMDEQNDTKQVEKEIDNDLQEIYQLFSLIKEIKNKKEDLEQVNSYYNNYLTYNLINEKEDSQTNQSIEKEMAVESIDYLKNTLNKINSLLKEAGNEFLINEYIFVTFNSIEISSIGNLIDSSNLTIDESNLSELLDINNQEIEYIIYGSSNLGGNLARSLEDIFLIRLAIRTTEGLTKFKGHPFTVFVKAISYGVKMATEDLIMITKGKEVELSTFVKGIKLEYKDYLRLLLFLHHDRDSKLSRTQALIHYNTGNDLRLTPTYIEAEVTTSTDFWFLPRTYTFIKKAALGY